jgi:hypothetical protein
VFSCIAVVASAEARTIKDSAAAWYNSRIKSKGYLQPAPRFGPALHSGADDGLA